MDFENTLAELKNQLEANQAEGKKRTKENVDDLVKQNKRLLEKIRQLEKQREVAQAEPKTDEDKQEQKVRWARAEGEARYVRRPVHLAMASTDFMVTRAIERGSLPEFIRFFEYSSRELRLDFVWLANKLVRHDMVDYVRHKYGIQLPEGHKVDYSRHMTLGDKLRWNATIPVALTCLAYAVTVGLTVDLTVEAAKATAHLIRGERYWEGDGIGATGFFVDAADNIQDAALRKIETRWS
jgi:hypothetical protein